jgi:cytochrome c
MPSIEWNKIIASVLTAMIIAMVGSALSNQIVRPQRLAEPVYLPPGAELDAPAVAAPTRAPIEPIEAAMANADPARGQQLIRVCVQCHTFEEGGANRIGPNLFGVMEQNIAAVPNYSFSPALQAHSNEQWDPEKMNVWLVRPQEFAPGNKMAFPGVQRVQDRADIVAYMQTLQ